MVVVVVVICSPSRLLTAAAAARWWVSWMMTMVLLLFELAKNTTLRIRAACAGKGSKAASNFWLMKTLIESIFVRIQILISAHATSDRGVNHEIPNTEPV